MGVKDTRKAMALRRTWESITVSVTAGLILWSITSALSRPTPTTERLIVAAAPAIGPATTPITSYSANQVRPIERGPEISPQVTDAPGIANVGVGNGPSLGRSTTGDVPAPRISANVSPLASMPGPAVVAPPLKGNLLPYSIPVGSILLYENFSRYRGEGDATDWGPNTCIRAGLDHRNWLVPNVDGTHPVGYRIRMPNEFCFECRYSASVPEVTRGVFGWWKDPIGTKISFQSEQGAKYSVEWVIRCGNDTARLNPLGSSSLYAKKYYHAIKLPDGTTNEAGVVQPTGVLRIDRDNSVVKVSIDGQAVLTGSMNPMGQLVGFEIDVVKAKNSTLSFTDFKISR